MAVACNDPRHSWRVLKVLPIDLGWEGEAPAEPGVP
jgi:hypothetical protein